MKCELFYTILSIYKASMAGGQDGKLPTQVLEGQLTRHQNLAGDIPTWVINFTRFYSHYLQLKLLSDKNARAWDSMDFT